MTVWKVQNYILLIEIVILMILLYCGKFVTFPSLLIYFAKIVKMKRKYRKYISSVGKHFTC